MIQQNQIPLSVGTGQIVLELTLQSLMEINPYTLMLKNEEFN